MPFVRLQRMLTPRRRRARVRREVRGGALRRNRLIARPALLTVIVPPGRMAVVFRWLKRHHQPAVVRRIDGRRFVVRPQSWLGRTGRTA
jgi:hypothetical protein